MKRNTKILTAILGFPVILIFLILGLIIGWFIYFDSKTGIYEDATATKKGDYYEIELKREARYMVHDPISLIEGDTYTETLILKLPRISGTVNGAEIPREEEGTFKYVGTVEFKEDNKMIIDLYYDNYERNTKDRIMYNGEYKLTIK